MLAEDESCPLLLERLVRPTPHATHTDDAGFRIEFDASPYGGGAVLRDSASHVIIAYFSVVWFGPEAEHLGVEPCDPKFQTFWEFATLLLALCVWGDRFAASSVLILGDNMAALSSSLSLSGKGPLSAIAREISWRKARRGWTYEVAHLPAEHNTVADALSRTADPKGCHWPYDALAAATPERPPRLQQLWLAAPH